MQKNFTFSFKNLLLFFLHLAFAHSAISQVTFSNQGSQLQTISGFSSADCAVDVNGDGLDDVVRFGTNTLYIDYQQAAGGFSPMVYAVPMAAIPSWSVCAADIDGNGYVDFCLGDGNECSFLYANDNGTGWVEDLQPEYIFSQRTTFSDIDNDGNLDAFVCHDVAQNRPYRNVDGVLSYDISLLPTLAVGGNYAAIWVDYDNDWDSDLYITKCRGGAAVGDPQRINLLYRNNGDGTFTSVGPEANMDDGDQSWATVFEDFDNDGDFDSFTVNHAWANRYMRNNGDGTFTDITASTGINASDLGAWNCDAGDFDNNGYVDIFSEMGNQIYWNNGDGTFTPGNLSFDSGGIGDFNNDGFLDVVAGNSLHVNNGNTNNWLKVDLNGLMSNKNGIGARVEIFTANGIQIREVRAGESFDPASSLIAHFGLGSLTAVSQVVVKWPSGAITTLNNPEINTTLTITEIECMLDPVAITVSGNINLCPGESVTLSVPTGTQYNWSNGQTTQSITVNDGGNYSAIVWNNNECAALSNSVQVTVITEEAPEITVVGEDTFCSGGVVVLSATPAQSYSWSNGQETQSIQVTEAGFYFVDITGQCSGVLYSSSPVEINVLQAPVPTVQNVTIGEPGTAILNATGNNLEWFATATSTEVLGTGTSFTTEFVNTQTSYWVQATTVHGGEEMDGGKLDNTGGGGLPSTGGKLIFNVTQPFTLQQVTCYVPSETTAGNRTVQLFDASGNLLQSAVVTCAIGTNVLNLNWFLETGDYQIGCAENSLFRNNAGVSYPYALGTAGSVTNSTFGSSYYYYFYNWQIKLEETMCVSPRVEATVSVVGINELSNALGIALYPNPAQDQLNITSKENIRNAQVKITDAQGRTVITEQTSFNGQNVYEINISTLAAGIYHVSVMGNNHQSSLEFVKQ
jgi:ASPIC and UnbV/Secretion system C-terminal sorting domain/FG-GAP-like repeat/Ig-like domain CHU_C associated